MNATTTAHATGSDAIVTTNGTSMAAILAAGIGAFAMGLVVILNEIGLVTIPALYAPAGGVSGRTTAAAIVWLGAWAVLHRRWKREQIAPGRVTAATLTLIVLGLVFTFPPVWGLL